MSIPGVKRPSLKEARFKEARRQIKDLCNKAYSEGKKHMYDEEHFLLSAQSFKDTKVYKIINNLKTIDDQIIELLTQGVKK